MQKNFKYFDALIHSGVKEIVLDSDIVLDDDESSDSPYCIKLDVDGLVIDGNGYAIDGKDKTCMFVCTGENITIKNITIKNFKFENPLMRKGRWSAINNCGGELTVIDSIITNNYGFGGAIYNEGVLRIINCKFSNNSAGRIGGAICNDDGIIIISNSIFTNNEAIHDGGAIYAPGGMLKIKKSTFSHNLAGYDGGVIYTLASKLSISESNFSGNTSYKEGGAIYHYSDFLNLKDCTFKDNKPNDLYKYGE